MIKEKYCNWIKIITTIRIRSEQGKKEPSMNKEEHQTEHTTPLSLERDWG